MSISVQDLVALSFLRVATLGDGTLAWVKNLKQHYSLDLYSGLTADGISVVTPAAGAPVAGAAGARWVAQGASSFASQAAWFIDPVGGNDESTGLTSLAPLQSGDEFFRRVGSGAINQATTVSLMNDFPVSNPFRGTLQVGSSGRVTVKGTKTPTVLRTSTFTAVVAPNPAAGVNEALQLTDTAIPVSWTASGLLNDGGTSGPIRIRVTVGTVVGAIGWASRDLGAKTARSCGMMIAPIDMTTAAAAQVNPASVVAVPAPGDTYVVETGFTNVADFYLRVVGSGIDDAVGAGPPRLLVLDLTFLGDAGVDDPTRRAWIQVDSASETSFPCVISRCDLGNIAVGGGVINAAAFSCKASGFFNLLNQACDLFGCLMTSSWFVLGGIDLGYDTIVDASDFVLFGYSQLGDAAAVGKFAVFDSLGSGFTADLGAVVSNSSLIAPVAIYGKDNAAYGVWMRSGSLTQYDLNDIYGGGGAIVPTLTGALGDTLIGGTIKARAALPFFNIANGAGIVVLA